MTYHPATVNAIATRYPNRRAAADGSADDGTVSGDGHGGSSHFGGQPFDDLLERAARVGALAGP